MIPSARFSACVEILSLISTGHLPADVIINNYYRSKKYIGAKDKKFITELVYFALRNYFQISHVVKSTEAIEFAAVAAMLRGDNWLEYFDNSKYSLAQPENSYTTPKELPDYARLNYPEWLEENLRKSFGKNFENELTALNQHAPLDLRVNTLKATREQALEALAIEDAANGNTQNSIRIPSRTPIYNNKAFKEGWVEVQDEGSQIACNYVSAKSGMKVIDFCAGAGGKTLSIAAQMNNKGSIIAFDISKRKLAELKKRCKRAGVHNVRAIQIQSSDDPFLKRHKQTADIVIADVPCSGTGTWRRNPHLKIKTSPETLANVIRTQRDILENAQKLVKSGGKLVYITCSILQDENEDQINWFLQNFPDFVREEEFLKLTPYQNNTDGFFAASLIRR